MIKYSYKIERFEDNKKIATFIPNKLPTEMDDITYIEGPNSSGKSTLLNIFATAFFGLNNSEIIHPLKKKMASLLDSKRNHLKFKVELIGKDNSTLLIAKKDNPSSSEIDVFEVEEGKEKRITADNFNRRYNLIYDIPQNPTERIFQLTSEIEDMQRRYGDRVGELKEYLRNIIREIESSKNPQSIKKTKESVKEKTKLLNEKENELKDLSKEIDLLEKAAYAQYYFYYKEENSKAWNQIMHLKHQVKLYDTKKTHGSREYNEYLSILNKELRTLEELQEQIDISFGLLSIKRSDELKLFEKIELDKVPEELAFPKVLTSLISKLHDVCSDWIEEVNERDIFQKAVLYKELIEVLEKYLSLNVGIPGTNKSVKDIIKDIKDSLKEDEPNLKRHEEAKKLKDNLEKFSQIKQSIEMNYLPTLKDLVKEKSDIGVKDVSYDNRILSLEEKHKKLKEKCDYYSREWVRKGRLELKDAPKLGTGSLKHFGGFDEMSIRKEISNMSSKVNSIRNEISSLKLQSELMEKELIELENRKPHKYHDRLDQLNKLYGLAEELEAKLKNEFRNYIKTLRDSNNLSKASFGKDQDKYNKAVFKYLGKRIEFYRHIDKYFEIDSVDLIDESLVTKEGKKIYFSEMGTGQSQSAYLTGKLNTSDNRPIIAFFDEVAMMDEKSLEPIFKKCKEMHNKGLLLLAIVVQKAKETKIESKVR